MAKKSKRKLELELAELKGAGKILDILWNNSYNSMGKDAVKRLEVGLIYYFGEDWSRNMYKIIEEPNKPHYIEPVKTLADLALE